MRLLTARWAQMLILLLMLAAILFVRSQDYAWIKSLRYLAFDGYNRLYPRAETDQVAIVDIDEASLARPEIGQWPWPRNTVARLVDNLHAMGARAIVFDIVFAEPDRTSPHNLLGDAPPGDLDAAVTQTIQQWPDHDQVFADAIARAGNVVTGFVWTDKAESTRHLPTLRSIGMGPGADILRHTVMPMTGVTTNIIALEKAAAGNGNFGVSTEVDGLIRSVPMLFRMAGSGQDAPVYPALSIEALRVAQDPHLIAKLRMLPPAELGLLDQPYQMKIGDYEVPLDRTGAFYVWFAKARPLRYIPAWTVLNNTIDPARIRDKIVFVGTSAEGLRDIRSTPLDLFIPGVEVHVNVVEQILTHAFLMRPALIEGMEFLAVAGIGLLIILLAPFAGAITMAAFTALLIIGIAVLSLYGYTRYGLLIDPVYPGLALLVMNASSSLLAYLRIEGARRQVKEAFGHYISPDYMKELTRNPAMLKLGGQVRDLTVMFTDIRNFTSIAERMPPAELIHLMNDFLTPMSDLVMKNRGTIDKYMGDAMMAFWNAPLDDPDHARHACIAALQMNDALRPLNDRLAAEGSTVRLRAGIGINTGPASVGNMGSRQRFAYSVMGDTVNMASRLEGQTKYYGVDILIGEHTASAVSGFAALELDRLRAKGKTEPARVFALLGDETKAADTGFIALRAAHEQMIARYRAGEFDAALAFLSQCQTLDADGSMTAFYTLFAERIAILKANPPPRGWDGVFTAVTK